MIQIKSDSHEWRWNSLFGKNSSIDFPIYVLFAVIFVYVCTHTYRQICLRGTINNAVSMFQEHLSKDPPLLPA